MLPCLFVPSVKKKGGKGAQQTKASRETHLPKNKEQHEGVCEEEKAQRGASVTTDRSEPSWLDTTSSRGGIFEGKQLFFFH